MSSPDEPDVEFTDVDEQNREKLAVLMRRRGYVQHAGGFWVLPEVELKKPPARDKTTDEVEKAG